MAERLSQNFSRIEFECGCNCGFDNISPLLIEKLQQLRDELGRPVRINSGCRCASHNEEVGGASASSHLGGFAADIDCSSNDARMRIIPVVCRLFRRVGVYDRWVHVDVDGEKDQDILWTD